MQKVGAILGQHVVGIAYSDPYNCHVVTDVPVDTAIALDAQATSLGAVRGSGR